MIERRQMERRATEKAHPVQAWRVPGAGLCPECGVFSAVQHTSDAVQYRKCPACEHNFKTVKPIR